MAVIMNFCSLARNCKGLFTHKTQRFSRKTHMIVCSPASCALSSVGFLLLIYCATACLEN